MNRFLIFTMLILMGGCSTPDTEPVANNQSNVESTEQKNNELTQEQLNEELKKEAVRADFVELNVDNPPEGKNVFAEGVVSSLSEGAMDEFTLTTNEEKGHGMYKVIMANTTDVEYAEGEIVRIYGGTSGKNKNGMPEILASIIEKVK